MGFYEAHARATMGWTGGPLKKEGGKLYDLAKARVIALGYGTVWGKLLVMCAMFGIPMSVFHDPVSSREVTDFKRYLNFVNARDKVKLKEILTELNTELKWTEAVNAWKTVTQFRETNPEIAGKYKTDGVSGIWERLENDCRRAQGGTWNLELPSGRSMHYFDIKLIGGLTGRKTIMGPRLKFWGGFLTENVTQALAREVMAGGMLACEAAGFETLFTVHDEIIFCVDRSISPADIKHLLIKPPVWAPDLPLDVSYQEAEYYAKD
jgi:hypothetical protein